MNSFDAIQNTVKAAALGRLAALWHPRVHPVPVCLETKTTKEFFDRRSVQTLHGTCNQTTLTYLRDYHKGRLPPNSALYDAFVVLRCCFDQRQNKPALLQVIGVITLRSLAALIKRSPARRCSSWVVHSKDINGTWVGDETPSSIAQFYRNPTTDFARSKYVSLPNISKCVEHRARLYQRILAMYLFKGTIVEQQLARLHTKLMVPTSPTPADSLSYYAWKWFTSFTQQGKQCVAAVTKCERFIFMTMAERAICAQSHSELRRILASLCPGTSDVVPSELTICKPLRAHSTQLLLKIPFERPLGCWFLNGPKRSKSMVTTFVIDRDEGKHRVPVATSQYVLHKGNVYFAASAVKASFLASANQNKTAYLDRNIDKRFANAIFVGTHYMNVVAPLLFAEARKTSSRSTLPTNKAPVHILQHLLPPCLLPNPRTGTLPNADRFFVYNRLQELVDLQPSAMSKLFNKKTKKDLDMAVRSYKTATSEENKKKTRAPLSCATMARKGLCPYSQNVLCSATKQCTTHMQFEIGEILPGVAAAKACAEVLPAAFVVEDVPDRVETAFKLYKAGLKFVDSDNAARASSFAASQHISSAASKRAKVNIGFDTNS